MTPTLLENEKFEREIAAVINRYSKENQSNTPDFILAQFVSTMLGVLAVAIEQREKWYGREKKFASEKEAAMLDSNEPCQRPPSGCEHPWNAMWAKEFYEKGIVKCGMCDKVLYTPPAPPPAEKCLDCYNPPCPKHCKPSPIPLIQRFCHNPNHLGGCVCSAPAEKPRGGAIGYFKPLPTPPEPIVNGELCKTWDKDGCHCKDKPEPMGEFGDEIERKIKDLSSRWCTLKWNQLGSVVGSDSKELEEDLRSLLRLAAANIP